MLEVAFLRSPLAHARIKGIRIPPAIRERVFIAEDLAGVSAIRADTTLPGFKSSVQPVLATGKVRYVGELVAMCVAPTRAEAEDLAAEIELDLEPLPVVADMLAARKPGAPLVHEHWGDNLFLTTAIDVDFEAVKAKAAVSVTRELRTSRQVMSPLEGRGVVAQWKTRLGQLVVHTSTQQPHIVRSGLAECLGLDEGQIRVVAPDVGGGFGYKGILLPEEVALAWATRKLGVPLRWIEDRRESLTANANCREHHYILTAYADADGRLLALDCEATVDSGAYSAYPFSACLEAGQVGLDPAGPLRLPALPLPRLFGRHQQAADPALSRRRPHRRVLRAGGDARCAGAQARHASPTSCASRAWCGRSRCRSTISPSAISIPATTPRRCAGRSKPSASTRCASARSAASPTAGASASALPCTPSRPATAPASMPRGASRSCRATSSALARFTPDGGLELRIGAHSHGQGLETTLSQVAHSILGMPHERIRLVHGDTAETPYSTGTWGSRCMIMAGGAVAAACDELADRVLKIGAGLLQAKREEVRLEAARWWGRRGASRSPTWRAPGIAARRTCRPTSTPAGSK